MADEMDRSIGKMLCETRDAIERYHKIQLAEGSTACAFGFTRDPACGRP